MGDQLDTLMDHAWDSGARVSWGRQAKQAWVAVDGLPGHSKPVEMTGLSLDSAAWKLLASEFPEPEDQA